VQARLPCLPWLNPQKEPSRTHGGRSSRTSGSGWLAAESAATPQTADSRGFAALNSSHPSVIDVPVVPVGCLRTIRVTLGKAKRCRESVTRPRLRSALDPPATHKAVGTGRNGCFSKAPRRLGRAVTAVPVGRGRRGVPPSVLLERRRTRQSIRFQGGSRQSEAVPPSVTRPRLCYAREPSAAHKTDRRRTA
jgi:hypothetical protein